MQALARLACTILCPNLLEVLDDNASLAALEIDPSSLPPSCSWLPTFVLTAAKYYSTGTSIAFNGSNGLGAALQLKALIPLTNTTATSDPFLPTFPTPSNNIPRPPLPTPNSQSTSSRPLVAQPLAPTHSQNSTPAAPYPNSNREKRNIPRSSPASTSKDARRKARYAPPALQAIAEESVDREELEELSEERAEMEITTGDEEVQEFVQGSSRDLEINGPAVRPHRASTARPRRPNPPQPPRPRPRPLSTPPPPLPPPAAASAPPLPSSASSVAQLRRTRSAQPPNLKSLRPSLTADSSIALVEKEEEEEIEEVKSTSSDEEEQQRFERVGEVGSAASVVSVDLEGESAIGGEESGDAGSTASQEDDGSVDSEEQDEEEHACFLEKPLEMMPNKLFVSEKASLSEEVPSGWFKIYKQLGKVPISSCL
ncbi:hypothetical protein BCR35DRAFT_227446 [Leucosporidium creatinivorum]|uniref:Uncharacterized protein n=1 Tax=Leucosporidium creatinivorum TaxID=106004 RepID=A0A1Y2D4Z4_9BASI|nr:hypothetical protein BCR35DRAFT_227446 [Leucosporidium creatinivorum]